MPRGLDPLACPTRRRSLGQPEHAREITYPIWLGKGGNGKIEGRLGYLAYPAGCWVWPLSSNENLKLFINAKSKVTGLPGLVFRFLKTFESHSKDILSSN